MIKITTYKLGEYDMYANSLIAINQLMEQLHLGKQKHNYCYLAIA